MAAERPTDLAPAIRAQEMLVIGEVAAQRWPRGFLQRRITELDA